MARILLVEDDGALRGALRELFEREGYEVAAAADAAAARSAMAAGADLVVQLGFEAKDLLLGLDFHFFFRFRRLAGSVVQQFFRVFLGSADALFGHVLAIKIAAARADQREDDHECDCEN